MWDMYRMFVIPEGKWGEKGAATMVGSGDAMARQAVELLELRQNDRVLEIGFGPGIGLFFSFSVFVTSPKETSIHFTAVAVKSAMPSLCFWNTGNSSFTTPINLLSIYQPYRFLD